MDTSVVVLRTPLPPFDAGGGTAGVPAGSVVRRTPLPPVPVVNDPSNAVLRTPLPNLASEDRQAHRSSLAGDKRRREDDSTSGSEVLSAIGALRADVAALAGRVTYVEESHRETRKASIVAPVPTRLTKKEALKLIDHAILQVRAGVRPRPCS